MTAHAFPERTAAEYAALIPHPPRDANKYSRGAVLIVGGSLSYPGAPVMAARAAARSGAGYVRLATPAGAAVLAHAHLLSIPITSCIDIEGSFGAEAASEVIEAGEKSDVFAIGPGLGMAPHTLAFFRRLMRELRKPAVFDADALNIIAADPGCMDVRHGCVNVFTPHAGEAARLLGHTTENLAESARELSARFDAVVVMKGPCTYVATPEGVGARSEAGGPELAKAGTGDVLTGMLAAFIAQGLDPLDASTLAVYLHSLAGRRVAKRISDVCVIPEDIIDEIGPTIATLGGV